jgi:hypothetical protein
VLYPYKGGFRAVDGTLRGIDAALATFRDLGAELREVQLSPLQDGRPAAR